MWFAALGNINQNTWLAHFAVRILEGKPGVLALMEPEQPFNGETPAFVRLVRLATCCCRPIVPSFPPVSDLFPTCFLLISNGAKGRDWVKWGQDWDWCWVFPGD